MLLLVCSVSEIVLLSLQCNFKTIYYELINYDASDEIGVQRILSEFQQIFAETVKSLDKVIENKERDMEEIEEEWDENRLIDKYNKMR